MRIQVPHPAPVPGDLIDEETGAVLKDQVDPSPRRSRRRSDPEPQMKRPKLFCEGVPMVVRRPVSNPIGDFLTFRWMITPLLIQAFFWLGTLGVSAVRWAGDAVELRVASRSVERV